MSVAPIPHTHSLSRANVPQLDNGDRLTRAEFERRYAAMPDLKKAELIEGIVYMASAVRHREHGRPHFMVATWLGHYVAKTPGVDPGDNSTLRLDEDNVPQPDVLMRLPEAAGGKSRLAEDGYLEGPVELAAEVAASSVSLDMHRKLDVYRRHGVREYLVWRVEDGEVDWFANREGKYEPMARDAESVIRSEVFPGLWLDTGALLKLDITKVLETLDRGIATPAHAEFMKRLAAGQSK
jgi:hypothetical protein